MLLWVPLNEKRMLEPVTEINTYEFEFDKYIFALCIDIEDEKS